MLTDGDDIIIQPLTHATYADRTLKKGVEYSPPPAAQDPYELDFDSFSELMNSSDRNLGRTLGGVLNLGGGISAAVCKDSEHDADAEIKDTIFTILGPGWVKTKIHDATIKAKNMAGKNYNKTLKMLNSNKCYSMEDLMMCIRWLLKAPKSIIGGRNFSAVHDPWQYKKISKIKSNNNIFKLRRYGNEIFK